MSDQKPPKRYKATAAEWEWFRTWFAGEHCWVCDGRWQELHHIVPRSHSGDDDIVNLAPVCRDCHGKIEARDPHARAALRGAFLPSNYEYFVRRLGDKAEGWLERNYAPRLPTTTEHQVQSSIERIMTGRGLNYDQGRPKSGEAA